MNPRSLAAGVARRWMHFWFEPTAAANLAFCRILFFALLFVGYAAHDFSAWGSVSRRFWTPIWLFEHTGAEPLDRSTLWILQTCWKTALIFSAIGLYTRVSMTVAFAAGAYLFGLPHNFGQTYHFDAVLVFTLGVLALSRANAALSLDALIARDERRSKMPAAPKSAEYTWPVRLVWVAMAMVFLGAATSKLRHAGIAWVLSGSMRTLLIRAHYGISDADPLVKWGLMVANWPAAASTLAAVSLLTELLFPLALFSVRARWILVPASAAMILGIRVLMGPTFGGFLSAYVFWPSWTAVGHRVHAWVHSRRHARYSATPSCLLRAVRHCSLPGKKTRQASGRSA